MAGAPDRIAAQPQRWRSLPIEYKCMELGRPPAPPPRRDNAYVYEEYVSQWRSCGVRNGGMKATPENIQFICPACVCGGEKAARRPPRARTAAAANTAAAVWVGGSHGGRRATRRQSWRPRCV